MSDSVDGIGIRNVYLPDLIFNSPYFRLDSIALVDGVTGDEVTYHQLFDLARKFAAGLWHLGVRAGDFVMLVSGNCISSVVCVLGLLLIRAVPSPINPTFTAYELKNIARLTRAKYWLVAPDVLCRLSEALESLPLEVNKIILLGDAPSEVAPAKDQRITTFQDLMQSPPFHLPLQSDIDPMKDVALLMFSSGTTGLSKGVKLSHHNIVFMILVICNGLYQDILPTDLSKHPSLPRHETTVAFIPFFHIFGLLMSLLRPLFLRSKIVIFPRFHPQEVFRGIQKYKVSTMCTAPPVMQLMCANPRIREQHDMSSLTTVVYGGTSCSKSLEEEFKRIYNIKYMMQGYGMTELSLAVLFIFPRIPAKYGSVGKAIPFTKVNVKCLKTGEPLGANQVGELCAKGPSVMLGYLNDEESTKQSFDQDGWFHTGDLAYYDDEGYFFLVDRIKDLIKYKAFQISPTEIENLLITHPSIEEVAIVGISHSTFGEIPKALVIKKQGCDITHEEITNLVKKTLSGYKHLRGGVEFVDYLPKNPTGKLLRRVLKKQQNEKEEKQFLKSKM